MSINTLGTKLKREDTSQGRYYNVVGKNLRYASVTTLISRFKDDFSTQRLKEWEQNIGVKEANTIRENSARRGTRVHKALEYTLTGRPLDITLDENETPYFDLIMPCFTSGIMKPLMLEEPIYWKDPQNSLVGFGGTADSLVSVDLSRLIYKDTGEPVGEGNANLLGDFKTWKTAKYPKNLLDVGMQLAGYCGGINQLSNNYYQLNRSIIIGSTNKKLYLYYFDPEATMHYWNEFYLLCQNFYKVPEALPFSWKAFSCKSQDLMKADVTNKKGETVNKWVNGPLTKIAKPVLLKI